MRMVGSTSRLKLGRRSGLSQPEGAVSTAPGPFSRPQREAIAALQQTWQRLSLHLLARENLQAPWGIGVTSAVGGEGKTTTAVGLAAALASESEGRVLLVEADLATATLAEDFAVSPAPGLVQYLNGDCDLAAALRPTGRERLSILPAGVDPAQRKETDLDALTRQMRRELPGAMERFKQDFTYVLVDLPAVLASVHTEAIVRELDGTLLVVRAGVTPLRHIGEAVRLIGEERVTGLVHLGPRSAMPKWLLGLLME